MSQPAKTIIDLKKVNPEDYHFYLFDTNVLIRRFFPTFNQRIDLGYVSFLDAVIDCSEARLQNGKDPLRIIMTSTLVSEIWNLGFTIYYNAELVSDSTLQKKKFRESSECHKKMRLIANEFEAIGHLTLPIEDSFSQYWNEGKMFDSFIGKLDFNDFILANSLTLSTIARQGGVAFVTDDKDFNIMGLPILTLNPKLLKLSRQ